MLHAGTERFDVAVIGFGIAGGSAALEAARAGARVLLLERAAVHGGTTCMAGGHFYLGGGTAVQQATGHQDSAEEMYKYLVAASKEPEHDKIRAYCEGSVEHFGWLEALGFEFERSFFPGKAVIQPGTEGLMFSGNEKVWPFRDQAKPAPRGHKVPVPGDTMGAKLVMDLLRDRVEEAGVAVRYETGATSLVIDETGAVVGLAWRSFGDTGVVRAGATVIAAGGFVMNPEMVAEYTPALYTPELGWHRRTRARGRSSTCDPATRSTPGSLWGVCAPPWTHKYSVPVVRSSRGCTQPELARPISPRTARGTAQAPSSARGHSSAGGLAGTRPKAGGARSPRRSA